MGSARVGGVLAPGTASHDARQGLTNPPAPLPEQILKALARRLPDTIWAIFEPILPAKVWFGNGRPPCGNRECLHALLYVLAPGISWEFLPWCLPSYKPVQRRLKDWLREAAFLRAWQQLAERYERLHGINRDQVLLDGPKKSSEKGVRRRGRVRSIAASRAPRST